MGMGRSVRERTSKKRREYMPGQLIMRVREGAVRSGLAEPLHWDRSSASRLPDEIGEPLDYLRRNAGLKDVEPIFSRRASGLSRSSARGATRQRLAVMTSVADSANEILSGVNVLDLDEKKITPALMKRLHASRAIEYAERMPARWTQARKKTRKKGRKKTGPDPRVNLQWGLRAIRWFQANRPDAHRIGVAVLDTGIDRNHPDLKGENVTLHTMGNGSRDRLGHGTHVAGIIAAVANNAVGIAGVASCKIEAYKIFSDQPDPDGEYYVDGQAYLDALRHVLNGDERVMNLSIAGPASSRTEALLFGRLAQRGVTVVAAMGNEFEEGNPRMYPAAYDGVIAVGSVKENLWRSWFSNTGSHIKLMAPGSNILSTVPRSASVDFDETDYDVSSGTSMAAPHVAGAAALVIAKFPTLNGLGIEEKLLKTRKLTAMRGSRWTRTYGSGLLDLSRALA